MSQPLVLYFKVIFGSARWEVVIFKRPFLALNAHPSTSAEARVAHLLLVNMCSAIVPRPAELVVQAVG